MGRLGRGEALVLKMRVQAMISIQQRNDLISGLAETEILPVNTSIQVIALVWRGKGIFCASLGIFATYFILISAYLDVRCYFYVFS